MLVIGLGAVFLEDKIEGVLNRGLYGCGFLESCGIGKGEIRKLGGDLP